MENMLKSWKSINKNHFIMSSGKIPPESEGPIDKSLFFYGPLFHKLFDPQLAEGHKVAVDLIDEGSSVLDIACGTGQLSFALRKQKNCNVVGIDLSLRMLDFARKNDPFQNITFMHEDATNLVSFKNQSFDYAAMLFMMHELTRDQQIRVLKEALRVAAKAILIDAIAPLPKNAGSIGIKVVEATFGHDHFPNFKSFLANGGLHGILKESGLPVKIEYSSVFWRDCRIALMVSLNR
jgi:SAM-dependent methyltransferase